MVQTSISEQLASVLAGFPRIRLAALFGSLAKGTAGPDSDIDVAIQADTQLTLDERIAITEAIALAFNRPVDLVDLRTAGHPLLHQIVNTGRAGKPLKTRLKPSAYRRHVSGKCCHCTLSPALSKLNWLCA